jgi:putative ABC transport system permease protein
MLTHSFKVAARNVMKYNITTLINVLGLSTAMAATSLMMLWVYDELTFDTTPKNSELIYRITCIPAQQDGNNQPIEFSPYLLADQIKTDFPEVEAGRFFTAPWAVPSLKVGDELYSEKKAAYIDKGWFNILNYQLIEGNSKDFFENPFSIILTESKAKSFFGNEDAIGKVIKLDSNSFQVRGIIKSPPSNSSFQFDILLPIDSYLSTPDQRKNEESWDVFNYITLVRLKSYMDIISVGKSIQTLLQKNSTDRKTSAYLKPISEIHFETDIPTSVVSHGNKKVVYIFTTLAFLLLLLACINYNNLTTAKASQRAKEVSVRKILGAGFDILFLQFVIESILIGLVSLLVALLFVWLGIPLFNRITEKELIFDLFSLPLWRILIGTFLITVVLNSVYPAILLSSFKPLNVLRGITFLNVKGFLFRKVLVVLQFTISMAFIISTIVIYRQLNYIQSSDVKYNRSQILTLSLPLKLYIDYNDSTRIQLIKALRHELLLQTGIENVSVANNSILSVRMGKTDDIEWNGKNKDFSPVIAELNTDHDFKNVFNLSMVEGQWFGENTFTKKKDFVLNETAVKQFGLIPPIINQRFILRGDTGQIIGIVNDFHFQTLHQKIAPLIVYNNPKRGLNIFLKVHPAAIQIVPQQVKKVWKAFLPNLPLDYNFLDEQFDALYKQELKISLLALILSVISIAISLLGLVGLTMYILEQRTKEIGIRRVLGASPLSIISLIGKNFLKLVLIALIVSSPISYTFMSSWLQDFAYGITIGWWTYFAAGVITLVIVGITVTSVAYKLAAGKIGKSLRTE